MDNMEKITLSIFVPCLNEEKNITNTLNNIKETIQNISYEIFLRRNYGYYFISFF